VQSVAQPTHRDGNTLDLVITRPENQPTSCTIDPSDIISDHSLVVCGFSSIPAAVCQTQSTSRQWRRVNRATFRSELLSALPTEVDRLRGRSAEELIEQYDNTLHRLADKFAPLRTTVRRFKHLSPWFDEDCRHSRRITRLLERHYRSSKSDGQHAAWIAQVRSIRKISTGRRASMPMAEIRTGCGD
jgi:hypothetical protein